MIKTLTHPLIGRTVRLGRRRPSAAQLATRRWYRDYKTGFMPPLPADGAHWATPPAMSALRQMYLNDNLCDCVIADFAHLIGVLTGNANPPAVIYTPQQIETEYGVCGYVPGDPATDQGCDEITVLNYLKSTGFPDSTGNQHKIAGWLALNAADPTEWEEACYLFLNVIFCMELPDAWINPFPAADNWTWRVAGAPDPSNGHCFGMPGYFPRQKIGRIYTWGMVGNITYAAIEKYGVDAAGGGVYTVLSQDLIEKAKQIAPNGLNWAQLEADFAAL